MLHNTAMLATLSLGGIQSARIDKDTTAFVLRSQQAEAEAGRWTARLWPKEALDPIKSLDARIRAHFHQKTLPWTDSGQRILSAKAYLDFMDAVRAFKFQREDTVREFLDHYQTWIDAARIMRGNSFDPDNYPSRQKAARRFKFELEISPLPAADDFRITIRDSELTRLQEELTDRLAAAEAAAKRDMFSRIAAPVSDLLAKLSDPDAKLSESTFNSVRAIAAAIPEINLWDDPAIEALRAQLATLTDLHAENLKESRSDRSRAASKASAILATMAPWLNDEDTEAEMESSQVAA
jgi:hypothetical protein